MDLHFCRFRTLCYACSVDVGKYSKMKSQVLLVGLFGACGFAATLDPRAIRATGAVTDDEIVDTLLRQDAFFLPKTSA